MKNLIESIRQRYQPQAEATMMQDDGKIVHNCAKHVEHAEWGKGNCINEEHAAPDRNGNIAWYDVMFEHGLERGVPTTELNILHAESHGHAVKKAKKVAEGNDGNLANNAPPYDKVTHGDVIAGRLGKDEMGGKKKKPAVKEEAGGIPEKPTGGSNGATPEDHNRPIKKKAMDAARAAADKTSTTPLGTESITKQGMAKESVEISMTAEQWDQLDELSKQTLGSYVKKAKEHAVGLGVGLGVAAMKRKDRSDVADKLKQRTKNIDKAVDRMTKEEVEQVDEISANLAGNYLDKVKAKHGTDIKAMPKKRQSGVVTAMDIKMNAAEKKIKEEVDVDETITYRSMEYTIAEADKNYDAHFKAQMKKAGIKHPGELKSDEEKKKFFNAVDAGFNAKNEEVFLEAMMASDLMKIKDAHKKAGNKISDEKTGSKSGEAHHSFVVTTPEGKRTRHIYHGSTKKVETMSAAPRSKQAKETGEDDDDK